MVSLWRTVTENLENIALIKSATALPVYNNVYTKIELLMEVLENNGGNDQSRWFQIEIE